MTTPAPSASGKQSDAQAPQVPALNPELIDRADLARLLAISTSTLDRMTAASKIPRPLMLSRGALRWRVETIRDWLRRSERFGRLLTRQEYEAIRREGTVNG